MMETENVFVKGLNLPQKEAVLYCDGPSLVIAGAGSGKTRVLTHKIAYLISKGMDPHRIMALTFTNKAAAEMKERIDTLLGYNASQALWMGTFHSIFGRMLRIEADKIGFTSSFTIYDTSDSQNLVKDIIKEMKLDEENYKYKNIFGRISACKNRLVLPDSYMANTGYATEDRAAHRPEFGNIYKQYCSRCRRSNVMDFDDLLLYTNILFKIDPVTLAKYQERFDYFLVDEYQDTNFAQYLIVKRLSEKNRRLFVVGDDAQSIYSFRGAEIQNILNFKNDYPDYKLFKLEQNYRSTQNIVDAANSLIKKNKGQIPKQVFSENEVGDKVQIVKAVSDNMEGGMVARKIVELHNAGDEYSNFAVLYRTNAQSRILEEAMRACGIPYKVFGGLSFYQRKEIKDALAYVRFAVNHNDVQSFKRIVNYPSRKIGQTTIDKVANATEVLNVPVWDIIFYPEKYPLDVNVPTRLRLKEFAMMINGFAEKIDTYDAYTFLNEMLASSGIVSDLQADKTPEGENRRENIQELLNGVKMFCDTRRETGEPYGIINYLENVSVLTDLEEPDDADQNRVSLMTIHSSKGLEYDNVFVTGVEENLFPGALTVMDPRELEEERRLFYVAITRAKKRIMLYYAENRFRFGKLTAMAPSRFLKDIDTVYVDWHGLTINPFSAAFDNEFEGYTRFQRKQTYDSTPDFIFDTKPKEEGFRRTEQKPRNLVPLQKVSAKPAADVADASLLVEGVRIKHKIFGEGKILSRVGDGENTKLIVEFDSGDTKTLLLKFAKLQILD
jgi:DNA helicase-2/ATP-dependent DNA helicase PcrA